MFLLNADKKAENEDESGEIYRKSLSERGRSELGSDLSKSVLHEEEEDFEMQENFSSVG